MKHSKQRKCRTNEKSVCENTDKKVVLCESEISYASKLCEQKLIICLGNTLSLVITMAQKSQKNFELDYTFLLEVSIVTGNALSFTDEKAKRYEINKRLGRIAATATAAYRKITGRAKEQLDKNVKKIHLFDDQLKSWQLDITDKI